MATASDAPAAGSDARPEEGRREEALDQAFELFLRFGYRKTSMDEIARAAGVSRQGLYLWFASKEVLFREMVARLTERTRAEIDRALAEEQVPVPERIVAAFDAYTGVHLERGMNARAIDELMEASRRLIGNVIEDLEADLCAKLATLLEPYADDETSAAQLAEMLYSVSVGSKYRADSRSDYCQRIRRAAARICR